MRAGILTDFIVLYKPTLSTNDYGEQIQEYVPNRETRTSVKHDTGSRNISNNEVVYDYTKTFIVRRYIEVCENYLIEYQKKRYRILSIEDNKRLNQKEIIAELINE